MKSQMNFFDLSDHYVKLSSQGDPLERLMKVMDFKIFLPLLDKAFAKERKSAAGRKAFDPLLMFKILILQSLYNLSDAQTEYQIKDRLSFLRFLGLSLGDTIPDEKTIWLYRETLKVTQMLDKLFQRFEHYLADQGFIAKLGHIVDASLVEAPKQRNSRDENAEIKAEKCPEAWKKNPAKKRQKDWEARWTIKSGKTYYGYKTHINIDVKHKLIRAYQVTAANVSDKAQLETLLEAVPHNAREVWADGAYFSEKQEQRLKDFAYRSHIINRTKKFPSHSVIARENRRRSKIRKRVEHIFGFMQNSMKGKFIRCIGLARATLKIGLMNLTYNICRYEQLTRLGVN
jgi:IS5 family transposase